MSLKRVGTRWTGLCPFHSEKSPSFSINAEQKLFHCLAGETRVITWNGIREIRELAGSTHRILTTNSTWVDAPFFSYGEQRLWKVTLGRNGQTKELYATDGHRWLLRNQRKRHERTTAELRPGHALAVTFPRNRTRILRDLSPFGIAHGIAYGDGTRFGPAAALDLHGEKDAQLLKWFPLNKSYLLPEPNGAGVFTKVLDLPLFFKQRPSLDEATTYLAGWLAGYLAADGHVSKDGTVMINSAHRENLEFVRDICTRLGIGTYGITKQERLGLGDKPSLLYRVHLISEDLDSRFFLIDEHRQRFDACGKKFSRRGWLVKSVEATDRFEEVFCAEVDGTHAFALEDNILTGNCFGCQASGDVITFVRETEHLDFQQAVEKLAAIANIQLRYDENTGQSESRKRRESLYSAMELAVEWFHQRLLKSDDAGRARAYLRERGYDKGIVEQFKIGWAPDDWDQLARQLKLSDRDLADTGLGFLNKRGRQQDSFRARVMFPIFDTSGRPVAFGGRILPGSSDPAKYKNSSETPIYSKRRILYGLNWAKDDAVKSGEIVVCEGYTDVIAFYLAGAPRAVATCGTAVTEEHLRVLRPFAPRIVLAYDADAAGQAAAERFYAWERDLDLSLHVLALPKGADPADLAKRDPAALRAALEGAKSFLDFRVSRALDAGDLRSPEGRAKAAENALAMVAEHPNPNLRNLFIGRIAGTVDIPTEQLLKSVGRGARVAPVVPRVARRHDGPETEALKVAIHHPEAVAGRLHEALFTDPAHRDAFLAIATGDPLTDAIENAPPDAAALLSRLAVEDAEADPIDVLAGLARVATDATVMRLTREMSAGGDIDALAPQIAWLKQTREQLGDEDLVSEATEALVTWLARQADVEGGTT